MQDLMHHASQMKLILDLYGDKGLRAEVIPESEVQLARAIDKS